jgi:hypothetical protein
MNKLRKENAVLRYVEEIPEGAVTIHAEISAYVTWAGESDKRDYGHLAITDSRLNNLIGKKVRVIIIESDE